VCVEKKQKKKSYFHFSLRCCAEKRYSSGKIAHLSQIQSNIKYNKVLALLNRTFRTLYDLNEYSTEEIEQKKETIKEGVLTCLALLRPAIMRENNQTLPTNDSKKKIIIKKKNFNILNDDSENDDDDDDDAKDDSEENDKENQSRRKTVRGSNSSKRSVSCKQQENESPSKRTKTTENLDEPLSIISPAATKKKITPTRKKINEDGHDQQAKSLRLTRKVQESKSTIEIDKSVILNRKKTTSMKQITDVRNDKGESLIHQAVKKRDIARVKQLIDEGHSVNTIDHNSWTPLHEVKFDFIN